MKIRAIGMLSGGLDSTLAVKLMAGLGIDVLAFNVSSPFCSCASGGASSPKGRMHGMTQGLGIPLVVERTGPEYLQAIRAPRFGYGKGLNPCQDCRIHTFTLARRLMEEQGARFVFTGEVLGQRPMSQQRDQLLRIEREAGLERLVVRPLSALHLPPTIPEEQGWVDRSKLLDISGRSRARQIELAGLLGVTGGACAGGGCLLTEPGFSAKVQDAFVHNQDDDEQIRLLRFGRHFRIDDDTKLVLGKNETENRILKSYGNGKRIFYRPAPDMSGPDGLLDTRREVIPEEIHRVAAALLLRYADATKHEEHAVLYGKTLSDLTGRVVVKAMADDEIARYRVPEKLTRKPYGPSLPVV